MVNIQFPAEILRCWRPASTNAKQARKNTRTNDHRSTANGSSPTL